MKPCVLPAEDAAAKLLRSIRERAAAKAKPKAKPEAKATPEASKIKAKAKAKATPSPKATPKASPGKPVIKCPLPKGKPFKKVDPIYTGGWTIYTDVPGTRFKLKDPQGEKMQVSWRSKGHPENAWGDVLAMMG